MPSAPPHPLIAIIDDDPTMRLICKTLLQTEAELVFGANAHEARDLMRTRKPDLVLLDDIMPGGPTGLSFLESLKDEPALSSIPIIMLTMSGAPEEQLRGLTAGASEYLVKPITPERLLGTVKAVLEGRRKRPVLLALRAPDLARELTEELERLNCLVLPFPAQEAEMATLLQKPETLVLLDHLPSAAPRQPSGPHEPKATFLLLGPQAAALSSFFAAPRTALLPAYETAADILLAASRLLSAQKNGGPKA